MDFAPQGWQTGAGNRHKRGATQTSAFGEVHVIMLQSGICPGNRLKIIQSHDSGCFTLSPASSPCPTIDSTTNLNSPIPSEIYENTSLCSSTSAGSQRQGKRRSWHIMPNKLPF
uniref:Uncharacterized protein n=1 Tax=Anopheles melas TaxID=34690 RepID=A0A182TSZ6_9DIPT